MDPKKNTLRHIIIKKKKKLKNKGKILKAVQKKKLITYRGNLIRLLANI